MPHLYAVSLGYLLTEVKSNPTNKKANVHSKQKLLKVEKFDPDTNKVHRPLVMMILEIRMQ